MNDLFYPKGQIYQSKLIPENLETQVDLVDLAFPLTLPPFPSPAMVASTLFAVKFLISVLWREAYIYRLSNTKYISQ